MKTKCKIWIKSQFLHTTINHRRILNAPLEVLMCPLQIINDIEPLSSTLHGVNACFIHHPSNVKNNSIGHKSETDWQNQKKKVILDNLFLHLSANFEVKIQNTQCYRSRLTFWHLKNSPIRGWGGLSKNVQKWPTIDPHINPPIHPTTYTPTHRWGCFSKSQIFKQNWIISISSRFIWFLLIWHDPIHWPTY